MKETLTLVRSRASAVLALLASLLVIMGLVAPSALAENMRERQWYLDAMQADSMWKVDSGKGMTVAVLDSGVDASEPELTGKVLKGKNFLNPKQDAHTDQDGHGTAMATLIAGNGANDQGIKGLAPDARILPLTVFGDSQKAGTNSAPALIKGIRYAADSDAQIISMSLGFIEANLGDGQREQIQQAVDYALKRGKLLFAATGNDGDSGNYVSYPAATEGVAAVGAVDQGLAHVKYSSYGSHVALAAPGEEIPIPCAKGKPGYCRSGGTSQATAITSGAAALIWAKHPKWTANQVLRVMIETAGKPADGKIPSRYLGYGTIRPRYNVLENKGDPGPADVNPLVAAKKPDSPSKGEDKGTPSISPKGGAEADNAAEGTEGGGGSAMPWILGAAGAVVVVGGGAFVFLRRRNAQRF
ncbi:S8 family serine peptidase [Streptomyces sp. NBRC 110028]|uniref:S8 family serine peptidase n=1 Tax=Streptomyces sp. NBRC 110028 TaxID=1621260 RepID=UPI0006E18D75|nr:S8 family serine peptidase [Streptomyces sp. NBRC 110028]